MNRQGYYDNIIELAVQIPLILPNFYLHRLLSSTTLLLYFPEPSSRLLERPDSIN